MYPCHEELIQNRLDGPYDFCRRYMTDVHSQAVGLFESYLADNAHTQSCLTRLKARLLDLH